MNVRVAAGTAMRLDLRGGKVDPGPTTAHFLIPGKCEYDCAYCTKARSSTANPDFLCRIPWPKYSERKVWDALGAHSDRFSRVCVQAVNAPDWQETAKGWMRRIADRCSLPMSVEIRTSNHRAVADLIDHGADIVGIPIDVACSRLYPVLRGGRLEDALDFVAGMADSHPGKISSHVILGLGETDKEVVETARRLYKKNIPLALFAFTPCPGTRLENRPPPDVIRYRRVQIATHILSNDPNAPLDFTDKDEVIIPSELGKAMIDSLGKAVLTRGCDGCNRPYYNERPGQVCYNFPKEPDEKQLVEIAQAVGLTHRTVD